MKGNKKVIELLNECLSSELTSINQYFLHAEMCENWGYERLEGRIKKDSIDEMKHAEALIERILYLEGLPNVQRIGKITVGETVPEIIKADLALEYEAVQRLNTSIEYCRSVNDAGSRELLEHILNDEEEHVDWLEAQQDSIAQVGDKNYLAAQIRKDS